RFQGKLAALRHGVAGVDHEIHDDLLDLPGICANATAIGMKLDHKLHFIAQDAEKHFAHAVDQRVEIERLRTEHVLAAEGKQLARQAGRALGGADDGLNALAHSWSGAVLFQHDFRVSANDHKQIVEI